MALTIALTIVLTVSPLLSADKPSFTVGWSVYVGWNPYYYMAKSGTFSAITRGPRRRMPNVKSIPGP